MKMEKGKKNERQLPNDPFSVKKLIRLFSGTDNKRPAQQQSKVSAFLERPRRVSGQPAEVSEYTSMFMYEYGRVYE